jgi:RNA polymerase sigma-70 factor (ECF subfamily)
VTVDERDWLAERFEAQRPRLRAVAYRMLGSLSEADDAVQEAWLRLSRSDATSVENLDGWLTTVIARVCLNILHSRRARREEPLGGRSPPATRQLASRARRRARAAAIPDADLVRQREVVDAFFAASNGGDFDALVAVLDPDVVLRGDVGVAPVGASRTVRGARAVAAEALTFSRLAPFALPALVNGAAGVVVPHGRPLAVMGFIVARRKIVEIDILADPARLRQLDLAVLDD